MLAKPLEEHYQSARGLARDLRECERQLAAPEAAAPAGPFPASALSADARPVVVHGAQMLALEKSRDRTRRSDGS